MKVFQFMDLLQPLDTILEHNHYIKILVMRVCVCITKMGYVFGGGRTRLVTHDLCTLYCVCIITSGHRAAAEMDVIGEQQLKRMQSAEVDVIREQ